jgi:ferritin
MLSKSLQKALNDQVGKEFSSAYLYLSMSAWFQAENLPGCAHWMRLQHQEEAAHALKLFDYLHDREGAVELQAIVQPQAKFGSPLDVFKEALAHERKVTASINQLYGLAQKENDYATQIALQWFVTEQVEEEKNAAGIVEQLKMVGENRIALLMLDRQLGARQAG